MSALTLYLPGLLGPWPTIYRPQLKTYLAQQPAIASSLTVLLGNQRYRPAETLHHALYAQLTPADMQPSFAEDRWRTEADFDASIAPPIFCADPVSMQAEMHGARIFDADLLALSAKTTDQLCADFNEMFAGDGYRWRLIDHRGYLFSDQPVEVTTLSMAEATETDIVEWGFVGRDAERFQKYATEWQMWLYQHPENVRRRASKALPISAIWLWGGGRNTTRSTPYRALYSNQDDRLINGLADRIGLAIQPLTTTSAQKAPPRSIIIDDRLSAAANALEWDAWLEALERVVATVIIPSQASMGQPIPVQVPGMLAYTPVMGVQQWLGRYARHRDFVEAVQWR